jgi:hypothetical protein
MGKRVSMGCLQQWSWPFLTGFKGEGMLLFYDFVDCYVIMIIIIIIIIVVMVIMSSLVIMVSIVNMVIIVIMAVEKS